VYPHGTDGRCRRRLAPAVVSIYDTRFAAQRVKR
jgi:hypothetical protein